MRFTVDLTCRACGGECRTVTVGDAVYGMQASTIVHCCECDCEWQLMARLLPIGAKASNKVRRLESV